MPFQTQLKKLGLKEKEIAVYLACLELGAAPVQQISRRARVVRATTYVVLDSLSRQGLVSQFKEGKKTLFSAEPPRQLTRLLERQEEVIEEKKRELEQFLPELQSLMSGVAGKPSVRYFEGIEGLRAIRREMTMYSQEGDTWYHFVPFDHLEAIFGRGSELTYTKQRVAKGISAKTIFTTKSPELKRLILKSSVEEKSERRYIPPEKFPFSSGMTVFRDRVAIGSYTGNIGGIIIESKTMAEMARQMFELAWRGALDLDEQ